MSVSNAYSETDARAEALRQMIDGDGWPYVQNYIEKRITDHTNQLLTCKIEDVIKHRAKVEALNRVLLFVKDSITEEQEGEQYE